jgi:hypothetical protein
MGSFSWSLWHAQNATNASRRGSCHPVGVGGEASAHPAPLPQLHSTNQPPHVLLPLDSAQRRRPRDKTTKSFLLRRPRL